MDWFLYDSDTSWKTYHVRDVPRNLYHVRHLSDLKMKPINLFYHVSFKVYLNFTQHVENFYWTTDHDFKGKVM